MIDNCDSFTYSLVQYFAELGADVVVKRNDEITVDQIAAMNPRHIVVSPGPCTPNEAGVSVAAIKHFAGKIPVLGVCLGHQAIAAAFGAQIVRAPEPMHGRVSPMLHDGQGVFAGLPSPFSACRYHSLVVDEATLPSCLAVSARTADRVVMAVRHRDRPLVGLQFHPESILTSHGYALLAAFLRLSGLSVPGVLPGMEEEGQEQERGRTQ